MFVTRRKKKKKKKNEEEEEEEEERRRRRKKKKERKKKILHVVNITEHASSLWLITRKQIIVGLGLIIVGGMFKILGQKWIGFCLNNFPVWFILRPIRLVEMMMDDQRDNDYNCIR